MVRTTEQPARVIGERMVRMRTWLDRRGIQLAGFEPVPVGTDKIAF
jgi:hypothetical protein